VEPLTRNEELGVEALMLLYSSQFRREHGDDVRQTYRDVLRDRRREGKSRFGTWLWLTRDAVMASLSIRRAGRVGPSDGQRGGEGMRTLWTELGLAARTLRRSPGFAIVVIVTMGLGIGVNTSIFAIVHSVLLAPLPYEDSEQLVWLMNRYEGEGTGAISAPEFWEYRKDQPALEGLAAMHRGSATLTGLQTPVQIEGVSASSNYFELVRSEPVLGRSFAPEEGRPGAEPVVIISHGLWTTAFGASSDVLGRSILLDATSVTVVGVMGADHTPLFDLLTPASRTDFWRPLVVDESRFTQASAERHGLSVIGRLAEGATTASAEVSLREAVHRVEEAYPGISNTGRRDVVAMTLRGRIVGDTRGVLLLLFAAVGLVLVLACVNVMNLLIARGETRAPEVAVRAALGARRGRLVLHVMSESLLIGVLSGAVGFALAVVGRDALMSFVPPGVPMLDASGYGLPVLGFCMALSVSAGAIAGAIPGARIARGDLVTALKAGSSRGSIGSRQLLKRGLVVVQVAGAVVLVAGAGLMVRSLSGLRAVDPGFDGSGLHMVSINAARRNYPSVGSTRALYENIESSLGAFAGVEAVAASWQTPLQASVSDWPVMPNVGDDPEWHSADPNLVTPAYFETYQVPLIAGRYFDSGDLDRSVGVVILNETAANRIFPDGEAVGRSVNLDFSSPQWREVVGVVSDIKGRGLGQESTAQTYMTLAPGPFSGMTGLTLTVRSALTSEQLRAALVDVMAGIDADIPVGAVHSMDEQLDATLAIERLLSALLSVFGAVALLLGSVGVYGLMAYSVHQRRKEIGLRMAMGADKAGVLGLIVRQGMTLGVIGVVIGIVGAVGAGRLLEGSLFGVTSTDVPTLSAVSLTILGVTALASYRPARRAASIDPLAVLREA
jgi:putative ABC transport system permease protein